MDPIKQLSHLPSECCESSQREPRITGCAVTAFVVHMIEWLLAMHAGAVQCSAVSRTTVVAYKVCEGDRHRACVVRIGAVWPLR